MQITRLFITILFYSLSSWCIADSKALERILPDHCIFSGEFNQTKQLNKLPVPLSSSGQLLFSCHHGLIWKNTKPFHEDLIYTLKNTHFRVIDNNEPVNLDGLQHQYLAKFLLSLLSSDIKSIQKDFDISLEQNTQNTVTINLSPTNTYAKKGLNSINIKKMVVGTGDQLLINIMDSKKQATNISIFNIANAESDVKDNMNPFCNSFFSEPENSCPILSDPQQYIDIKLSN